MDKLKKRLENIVHTLKYALSFAATAFIAQEVKGQDIVYPSGVINPFLSPDNTTQATTYNALNSRTKAERDALLDAIIKASRVHTIPGSPEVIWNCQHWTLLEIVNSYNWGKDIYNGGYEGALLLYNNYDNFVLSDIYANGGTFADDGKNGIPMFKASFSIPLLNAAHTYCTIITGNNILNGKDWYDIEERDGITNVQPGQLNLPLNTPTFMIIYPYIYENAIHKKNLGGMRILEFKIVNGQKILTYNINDDPNFNTRMRLITQRESDAPVINLKQSVNPDSLVCTINDANLKSVWYTVDDGAKIPLMTEVLAPVTEKKIAIKMNLPNGTHQIKIGADDYFRLITEKTEQRTTVGIDNPSELKDIKVYPIPVKDILNIEYKFNTEQKIQRELYDTNGRLLSNDRIKVAGEQTDRLDMSRYANGMYILKLTIGSEAKSDLIIKQ